MLAISSCSSYPERNQRALRDFEAGQFEEALGHFGDAKSLDSAFLSGAEAGTICLAAGDWESAQDYFGRAAAAAKEIEGRALAGSEELGETLASWVINDSARAYQGEGFERVYVHCGLALAFLAQGSVDDVYVEARLANQLLEAEEKLYDKKYLAGGWGHLISGLAYELAGQPGEAYLDYARMEAKGVGKELAIGEMRRLADALGREDELRRLRKEYGDWEPTDQEGARIMLLAGVGLAPYKYESGVVLGTGDGVIKIVAPSYQVRSQPVSALRLSARSASTPAREVQSGIIEDVSGVAQSNLTDRLAWSVAKSTARTFLKRELSKSLQDKYGSPGALIGGLFTLITERADLRSWMTLPDTWQAARLSLPAGIHHVELAALGGEHLDLGRFELEPGELMIIIARSLGSRIYAYPIGGRRIEIPVGG